MKEKTKQDLLNELTMVERERRTLRESFTLEQQHHRDTRHALYNTQQDFNRERNQHSETQRALRNENAALRKELAQAQSALYTLINKLPGTL